MISNCHSKSNVFPVLFGEKSNPNALIAYAQLDYNEFNNLVAGAGIA